MQCFGKFEELDARFDFIHKHFGQLCLCFYRKILQVT